MSDTDQESKPDSNAELLDKVVEGADGALSTANAALESNARQTASAAGLTNEEYDAATEGGIMNSEVPGGGVMESGLGIASTALAADRLVGDLQNPNANGADTASDAIGTVGGVATLAAKAAPASSASILDEAIDAEKAVSPEVKMEPGIGNVISGANAIVDGYKATQDIGNPEAYQNDINNLGTHAAEAIPVVGNALGVADGAMGVSSLGAQAMLGSDEGNYGMSSQLGGLADRMLGDDSASAMIAGEAGSVVSSLTGSDTAGSLAYDVARIGSLPLAVTGIPMQLAHDAQEGVTAIDKSVIQGDGLVGGALNAVGTAAGHAVGIADPQATALSMAHASQSMGLLSSDVQINAPKPATSESE